MSRWLEETSLWVSHLLFDAGKAAIILAAVVGVVGGLFYAWFGGASLTVENQSGRDLEGVKLLTGHPEAPRDLIWSADLRRGETEWSYTFTGKDRAVLQYVVDGRAREVECPYPSEGLAVSARMIINPDGTLTCDSDMRL